MRKLRSRGAEESAQGTQLLSGGAQFYYQPPLRWSVTTSPLPHSLNTLLSLLHVLLGRRVRKWLPHQKDQGRGEGWGGSWIKIITIQWVFIKRRFWLILFHPTRLISGRHVNVPERVGAQQREKIGRGRQKRMLSFSAAPGDWWELTQIKYLFSICCRKHCHHWMCALCAKKCEIYTSSATNLVHSHAFNNLNTTISSVCFHVVFLSTYNMVY